jgi:hypothetical protein
MAFVQVRTILPPCMNLSDEQWWNRRKYNHFVRREGEMDQFGATDSGLMAWDFEVNDVSGQTIGSINRYVSPPHSLVFDLTSMGGQ